MTAPTVFISYSQDSDEHKDRVLDFADRLCKDGVDANIDQYQVAPPDGWQLWMEKQIRDSQFVLLVCTETYLRRVMREDSGKGLGVMWESTIISQYLYDSGVVNKKFIPVVFGRDNTKNIPMTLKQTTFYDVSTEGGYEALYRRLTKQPDIKKPKVGKPKPLPPRPKMDSNKIPPPTASPSPSSNPSDPKRESKENNPRIIAIILGVLLCIAALSSAIFLPIINRYLHLFPTAAPVTSISPTPALTPFTPCGIPEIPMIPAPTSRIYTLKFTGEFVSGVHRIRNVYYCADNNDKESLGATTKSISITVTREFAKRIRVYVELAEDEIWYEELYVNNKRVDSGNVGNEGLYYVP